MEKPTDQDSGASVRPVRASAPKSEEKRGRGRPTLYRPEYAAQARKLCLLGATESEIEYFFSHQRDDLDFYRVALGLIREDRRGVFASRNAKRAETRAKSMTAGKRITNAVRSRIYAALRGKTSGKSISRLPYSIDELRAHLEKLFVDGMSWANYGSWHIDHIKPCASFDMTDQAQFDECWAISNLRPLWAVENIQKGARYGSP